MSIFHPFPRLPLELRHRIFELAVVPREVAVGLALQRRARTGPPVLLRINSEARAHLLKTYVPCFGVETRQLLQKPVVRYSHVSFEWDAVYCNVNELGRWAGFEVPRVRRLVLECRYAGEFFAAFDTLTCGVPALEELTVLLGPADESWWMEWMDTMQAWYHRCDPVPFFARIVGPDTAAVREVRRDNWLEVEREWRRSHEPTVEENPEYGGMSDEEDDADAPWRYREFRHADGCSCASKKKDYVQIGDVDAGKAAWELV